VAQAAPQRGTATPIRAPATRGRLPHRSRTRCCLRRPPCYHQPLPIDIRPCHSETGLFRAPKVDPARQQMWMRSNGTLGDDLTLHQCVVAYASDFRLLATGLLPHGLTPANPRVKFMASLDHSMWFHQPFRADEWLLYQLESPKMNNGRCLAFGQIYTQDGRLVVSVAQEGLIRVAPPRSDAGRAPPPSKL